MQYRREIDGLRALAVIPVILFHAGFTAFSGGFVGVDVFFVISGYLITGLILVDLETGQFTLTRFYERRARRILPALFVVVFVSAIFAWLWLIPGDMKEFAQSARAVGLFVSNVFFYRDSGYFAIDSHLKPLLHTWSLSVEEQFYLIMPLTMVVLWRFAPRALPLMITGILTLSFGYTLYTLNINPDAAFYLLPTRAWELMLGAILAYYAHKSTFEFPNAIRQTGAFIGTLLIGTAIVTFDSSTPFPSIYALVPTLGAVLILAFATPDTFVGRLLAHRVLVGIGLISYSAYLWHQPLFAFANHRLVSGPSTGAYIILSALALTLAYFTWRYVEQPFRRRDFLPRRVIIQFAVAGSVFLVTFGTLASTTTGSLWHRSFAVDPRPLEHAIRLNHGLGPSCMGRTRDITRCETGRNPEVLVWGDSYAMHLTDAILVSQPRMTVIQKTMSFCGPVMDLAPVNSAHSPAWARQCIANNDAVLEYIRNTPSLKLVVLSSRFEQYFGKVMRREGQFETPGEEQTLTAFMGTLGEIRRLGITPIVVSPPPQNGENIGRCLVKASIFGNDLAECDFPLSAAQERQKPVYDFLSQVAGDSKVIWLSDFLCKDGTCRAAVGDTFIYRDSGHLSHDGSTHIGQQLRLLPL